MAHYRIHRRLLSIYRAICLVSCGLAAWATAEISFGQTNTGEGAVESTAVDTPTAATATPPETAEVKAIIAAGQDTQVQSFLDMLCNRIGPRLTSSAGLQAGCEWARDEFTRLGLQNSRLEQWGEFPVGFERGPSSGRMLSPRPMELTFGTNAWTAGTAGRVAGPAVLAPRTLDELNQISEQIAGAWVLVERLPSRGGRGNRGDNNETPPANPNQMREVRAKLLEMKPAGIIQPTAGPLILTGGNYQVSWDSLPQIPQITLLQSQWDEIAEMLRKEEKVELGFDIRNFFRRGPIPLYNVIAEIPGTEFPDEYVVIGGHIDSWDGATGATDNAAGCATTLEAARILMAAGVRPRRTIRFMLWSGEEQGLMGSRAYVKQNLSEMPKISAVFVHDGGTNYVSGIETPPSLWADFEAVFAPAKLLDPRAPFELQKTDIIRARGGSDHVSFIQAGVPGFFWRQSGRATYRDTHHTQFDTFDSVVPEYQQHSATVIALAAWGVANLDHMLSREHVQQQ